MPMSYDVDFVFALYIFNVPEYAVWVKSRDELMNDPVLVVGQKPDMEKAFGNKISLLPKYLSDLNPATKYEGRIIIQESDDKIANTF
jgi:hypothetical protein